MRAMTSFLVVLALTLGLAACGGRDEATPITTTETETPVTNTDTQTETTDSGVAKVVRITVTNGLPAGGIVRQSVSEGDRVVIVVNSDVADEIHLHGYDLKKDVTVGGTARIPFRATIPGRFEVELEQRGTQIAELTVNP